MYLFKLKFLFFGYVSCSGIAKSCGSPIFSFARNHHTLLQWLTSITYPPTVNESSLFSISSQHLLFVFFWWQPFQAMRWYLIVLIFISLMISNIDLFFIFAFLLWKNIYSVFLPIFLKYGCFCFLFVWVWFFWLFVLWYRVVCWILIPYQLYHLQIKPPQVSLCSSK